MSELGNNFSYNPAHNLSRKAAIVGETVTLRRADLVPLASIKIVHQPNGADVQFTPEGGGFVSSALSRPGVYHFEINEGHVTGNAYVCVWPEEILGNRAFTHTESTAERSRGEADELARRVLQNIAAVCSLSDDLFVGHWFPGQLCGGKAGEGLSLQPYGAR